MKHLTLLLVMSLFILAACQLDPVRPQEVYEATATARAEMALLPTVTATPAPQPTAPIDEPEVLPECNIKVNFNGTEWIFHLPGQVSYERTIVEPDKGEAFVCTEQEAIDMGARKALR